MNLSEFGWYCIRVPGFPVTGLQLRRGGADGVLFASVAGMEGEPWVAVVGLQVEHDPPIPVRYSSEAEAIERVEAWLEDLLTPRD